MDFFDLEQRALEAASLRRLTSREVARLLGIKSLTTLRSRRKEPGFPQPIVEHGRNYWLERDILIYIFDQAKKPKSPPRTVS